MAWSFIGTASASAQAATVSVAYTPTGGMTANHLLVYRGKSTQGSQTGLATSVTDSLSNTWTKIITAGPASDTGKSMEEVWYTISAALASGSTLTVTIGNPDATQTMAGRVMEFTGNATSGVVDTAASAGNVGTGTALSVAAAASSANAGELAVTNFGQAIGDAGNWAIGSGWTSISVSTNSVAEYQVVTNAGTSVTGTGTGGSSTDTACGIIVLFVPAGASTDPFPVAYGQPNRQLQSAIYRM